MPALTGNWLSKEGRGWEDVIGGLGEEEGWERAERKVVTGAGLTTVPTPVASTCLWPKECTQHDQSLT